MSEKVEAVEGEPASKEGSVENPSPVSIPRFFFEAENMTLSKYLTLRPRIANLFS